MLDGVEQHLECDTLVLPTPNIAETTLAEELTPYEIEAHQVGDCVAPRWAVHAIYEGRKLGRVL